MKCSYKYSILADRLSGLSHSGKMSAVVRISLGHSSIPWYINYHPNFHFQSVNIMLDRSMATRTKQISTDYYQLKCIKASTSLCHSTNNSRAARVFFLEVAFKREFSSSIFLPFSLHSCLAFSLSLQSFTSSGIKLKVT
jgi:hypothetical protein